MSSEETRGLPKQPGNTCPMIDEGQKALKKLTRNKPRDRDIERGEENDLRAMLDELYRDIDWNANDVDEALENCRQQAIDLREWGQAWKDLAKENLDKVESVQTPWDGVMLWWREIGEPRWHLTWLFKACVLPRRQARSIPQLSVI